MTRCIFLLLVCSCVASCLYPGAPISFETIPPKPPVYYSCLVGSKWVYRKSWEDRNTSEAVTEVREEGGAKYVTVRGLEDDNPKHPTVIVTRVSAEGLDEVMRGDRANMPATKILKLPYSPGETWETKSVEGNKVMAKAVGTELVIVPAGVYRAIRVDYVQTLPPSREVHGPIGGSLWELSVPYNDSTPSCTVSSFDDKWSGKSTMWFAPDVGMVKWKTDSQEIVLKSFTPGKEVKQPAPVALPGAVQPPG